MWLEKARNRLKLEVDNFLKSNSAVEMEIFQRSLGIDKGVKGLGTALWFVKIQAEL